MFLANPSSEYDRGVNTFSPEGRLFQVEYAIEAIKLGSTALGIQAKDGVILAVERRVASKLLISDSIQKMFEIDRHIAVAASGLTGDSQTLVEHARATAVNHTFVYDEPIKTESLAQSVSDVALRFGDIGEGTKSSRPYGVALLFAGFDESGPKLYVTDPSGTYMQYQAKAIGSAGEAAQVELVEQYKENLSTEEALTMALKILTQVMEEKISKKNIQIGIVDKDGYRLLDEAELERRLTVN